MILHDALIAIVDQLRLNIAQFNFEHHETQVDALIAYAAEDTAIGGYHPDASQARWASGSIWGVEGQILYALVRALRPEYVGEFGVGDGCASTHILAALEANGGGWLISVDPWQGAGNRIPAHLRARWEVHFHSGIEKLRAGRDATFDILFEDMLHSVEATRDWWRVAQQKIKPGGVIISHDAEHITAGDNVRRGIAEAGIQARTYLVSPSDCGLAIWRAPYEVIAVPVGEPVSIVFPENAPEPKAVVYVDANGERIEEAAFAGIPIEEGSVEAWSAPELTEDQLNDISRTIAGYADIPDLDAEVHAPVAHEDADDLPPVKAKKPRKPRTPKVKK